MADERQTEPHQAEDAHARLDEAVIARFKTERDERSREMQ